LRAAVYEALRFNPQTPALLRHCSSPAVVGTGQRHATTVPTGTEVVPLTLAAMFDPAAFPEPGAMRFDRDPALFLHFGHGMHECFGSHINGVQIPEIVAAALRLPNLRRASGTAGRIAYDGPFPDRLVLEFDRDSPHLRADSRKTKQGRS
jgi:cytochrome P450